MIKSKPYAILAILVASSYYGATLELPSDFKQCKRSDANLNECLRDAIQDALPKLANGLPEFRFPPLQPLYVRSITIGEGPGVVHVVQKFSNVEVYDIIRAQIEKVDSIVNDTYFHMDMNMTFPDTKTNADYDFDGKIFRLPIMGQGKSTVTCKNSKAFMRITGELIKKKGGVAYMNITDIDFTFSPENIAVKMENLFNGDQRLGDDMNALLNEHWKVIWEDVQTAYEKTFALVTLNTANIIFRKVAYETLFPL